jgi:hypothetical protein
LIPECACSDLRDDCPGYRQEGCSLGPKLSSNPKKQYGTLKPSISFIPPVALLELAVVMELGAVKYGAHNWVTDPVDFTTYYDAAMRHLMLAFSGQDIDDESKALHVAHAMACCAILTDAIRLGNLVDDRPKTGDVAQAIRRLTKSAVPKATASEVERWSGEVSAWIDGLPQSAEE